MPNITFKTSDKQIFEIDVKIAKCFGIIKTMLEDCGMEDDVDTIVPLHNVHSHTFRKVIEWADYHKDDVKPVETIAGFDAAFLKVDQSTLYRLILAANYLDIKGLLTVACRSVADMIKGKSPEENRKLLKLKYDFPLKDY